MAHGGAQGGQGVTKVLQHIAKGHDIELLSVEISPQCPGIEVAHHDLLGPLLGDGGGLGVKLDADHGAAAFGTGPW